MAFILGEAARRGAFVGGRAASLLLRKRRASKKVDHEEVAMPPGLSAAHVARQQQGAHQQTGPPDNKKGSGDEGECNKNTLESLQTATADGPSSHTQQDAIGGGNNSAGAADDGGGGMHAGAWSEAHAMLTMLFVLGYTAFILPACLLVLLVSIFQARAA